MNSSSASRGSLPSHYFHNIDQDLSFLNEELSQKHIDDTFRSLKNAAERLGEENLSLDDLLALCTRFDQLLAIVESSQRIEGIELAKAHIVPFAGQMIKRLKLFPTAPEAIEKRIHYLLTIVEIECQKGISETLLISFYSQILYLSKGPFNQKSRKSFFHFYERFLQKHRHLFIQHLGLAIASDNPLENFKQSLQILQEIESSGLSFSFLSDLYGDASDILSKQPPGKFFQDELNAIRDEITGHIYRLRNTQVPSTIEISGIEVLVKELQAYRAEFYEAFEALKIELNATHLLSGSPSTSNSSSASSSSSSSSPSSASSSTPSSCSSSFDKFQSHRLNRIEIVRRFQRERFERFQSFFKETLLKSPFFIFFPRPQGRASNYDIRVVGSMGRGEPTPFSDLEFFILTRSQYQEHWHQFHFFLEITCRAFGEGSPISTHGMESNDFICKGFYLDSFSDPSLEVNTPEGLAALQTQRGAEENILELTSLLKSSSLLATDPTLMVDYQDALQNLSYEQRALALLRFRLSCYQKASHGAPLANLKTDYIELLHHTLNDISLYHHIQETNLLDIIEELVNKGIFTQPTGVLLQDIAVGLYQMRIELQHFYHYNEGRPKSSEEILLSPPTHPSEAGKYLATSQDKLLLNRTLYLVLKPLYAKLEDIFPDSPNSTEQPNLDAFNEFDCVAEAVDTIFSLYQTEKEHELHTLLLACHSTPPSFQKELYLRFSSSIVFEPIRERYIDLLEGSNQQELFRNLLQIPNPAGYRQKDRIARRNLQRAIADITTEQPETPYRIEGPLFSAPRYLKSVIAAQIIDSSGNLRSDYSKVSSNRVCNLQYNGINLHLKQAPQSPDGSPYDPGKNQAFSRFMMRTFGHGTSFSELVYLSTPNKKGFYVLISQTVFGENLAENLTRPDKLAQLDRKKVSDILLSNLVTYPGDDRPVNFVEEEGGLTCVDPDVAWVKPMQKKKTLGFTRFSFNLYAPLFFIFPDFILDLQAIDDFISLQPDLLLREWFKSLISLNREYETAFQRCPPSLISPFFEIDQGMGAQIFIQFCHLQNFLRKNRERPILAEELLKTLISYDHGHATDVGQIIYEKYQEAKALPGTASDKIKLVTGRDTKQSLSFSQSRGVMYQHISSTPKLVRPEQSLRELDSILQIFFQEGVSFSQRENHISRIVRGFEDFIRPDGSPDISMQEILLEFILTLTCDKLVLSNCQALTDQYLIRLMDKNGKNLTYLDLRGCSAITEKSISLLSEKCPYLQKLYLSRCRRLTYFSGRGRLAYTKAKFLFLQELHIAECPQLTSIHLQSYVLTQLKADRNRKLTTVELDTAVQPQTNFSNCPLLQPDWKIKLEGHIANNETNWGNKGETLFNLFSSNREMQTLNLKDANLNSSRIQALIHALRFNSSLRELELYLNKLGETEVQAITEAIRSSSLTNVKISCRRSSTVVLAFAKVLKHNSSLNELELRTRNNIGLAAAQAIGEALMVNSSLRTLQISDARDDGLYGMGDAEAIAIAEGLKSNSNLTKLNLYQNSIGCAGATALADALHVHPSLKTLNLAKNKIGIEGGQALQDAFEMNISLENLSWNSEPPDFSAILSLSRAIKPTKRFSDQLPGYTNNPSEYAQAIDAPSSDSSSDLDSSIEENLTFEYDGNSYERKFMTREDEVCALHALLGTRIDNEYIWRTDGLPRTSPIDDDLIQLSAKKEFLSAVKPLLDGETGLRNILIACMKKRLVKTAAFKAEMLPLKIHSDYIIIGHLLTELYVQHQLEFDLVFKKSPIEWNRLNADLTTGRNISKNLLNCFNANFDSVKKIDISDPRWSDILTLKLSRIDFEEQQTLKSQAFIENNFALYSECIEKGGCYLTLDELKLAIEVFLPPNIKVLIFSSFNGIPLVIHPNGDRAVVAIEHSVTYDRDRHHFSRLENTRAAASSQPDRLPLKIGLPKMQKFRLNL